MHEYLISFLGGTLLGISAVGYLYVHGRIAGISGLLAQSLNIKSFINSPAFWFLTGLIVVPFIYALFTQPEINIQASPFSMIIAGLLVGFGTRLGSGCTSGHGICGISRLSPRSLLATVSFMLAGFVTVYIVRHLLGANT
ncbi:YeeE/YedE family protein [Acinetobacter faecalis]|uniref:YeeE/YedE family protein n=1 Tax=Acinetobacter faecalis TaxID=2665161 RepID=UPI002A90F380|nr:YeeE/YedE family protein [Acinetobacter faecalis]MDY6449807.1 YeeE/YedE family protein [Acinetobacter faecalis]